MKKHENAILNVYSLINRLSIIEILDDLKVIIYDLQALGRNSHEYCMIYYRVYLQWKNQ